jgi:hypothetical protein
MAKIGRGVRITTNDTFPFAEMGHLKQVVIACRNAGTTWKLRIQDKAGSPKTVVPDFTLTVPTDGKPMIIVFDSSIPMEGGLDIMTPSGTPGEVSVWITGEKPG